MAVVGTISIGVVPCLYATDPLMLKQRAADYVLDSMLLKQQDQQKVKNILEKLPEGAQDSIKERIITRYKLPLFSALSLTTIPAKTITEVAFGSWSIGFSSDNRYALITSYANTAYVLDLETGQTIQTLRGHTNNIESVAFSKGNEHVLTGSWDAARLWDLRTGQIVHELRHTDPITSVALSENGRYALIGSLDATAHLWDLTNVAAEPRVLQGHSVVRSVTFSHDGQYALTGFSDGTACLWDLTTGQTVCELKGHTHEVVSVALSKNGRYALTGSIDNTARLWDITTPTAEPRVLQGHTDWVNLVAFSPDGRYALTGSQDTTACLWDLTNIAVEPLALQGHTASVQSLAFSHDGRHVLTGSWDSTVRLWDLEHKIKDLNLEQLVALLAPSQH